MEQGNWGICAVGTRRLCQGWEPVESGLAGRIDMNLPRLTTLFVACLMALLAGVLWCPWIARADAAINGFFDPYRKQPLLDAFLWLTAFGAKPAIVAVCLTATGLFRIARMKGLTLPLWVAFLGGEATSWSLKHLV